MCWPIRSCIQPDNTHTPVLQWLCLARQPQATLGNNVTLNLRGSGGNSTGDGHEIQALNRPGQRPCHFYFSRELPQALPQEWVFRHGLAVALRLLSILSKQAYIACRWLG